MLAPADFAAGTAERAIAEYLNAWKNRDWQRMVQFTQKTWRSGNDDRALTLEAQHDFKELLGAGLLDTASRGSNAVAITVSRIW